ncbi:UNVERIFIED_ORG: Lar family restriction alleviation protein [Stenotrophomonas maltophilia]
MPCPFCGARAERIDFGPDSGDNEGGSCVACTSCQSSGPVEFGYKENFISNWNRRALSAHPSPGGQDASGLIQDLRAAVSLGRPLLHSDVDEIAAALTARQPVGVDDATDRALGETIEQRDRCEEVADELATHIAAITGVDIGEHSSANCPWQNAIEAAEEYKPAQAVNLAQLPHGIRLIEIPRRNNLDPINVFVQDYELGRGRIVVICYGQAWCGFWGAMGDRTVMQFVAACDADYVAGNMLSGRHEHVKKHERVYVERIATEVIAEFRAMIASQAVGK